MRNISTAEVHEKFRFKMKLELRWSDMDEMHHINNAVYLTYLEQARVYYFHETCKWNWKQDGAILLNAHIEYIKPLRFPEPAWVYVRTCKMGNKSFELDYAITRLQKDGTEEVVTCAKTVMVTFDYKTDRSMEIPEYIRAGINTYEKHI
jgi:acyl-CoA thioester hydrolase